MYPLEFSYAEARKVSKSIVESTALGEMSSNLLSICEEVYKRSINTVYRELQNF